VERICRLLTEKAPSAGMLNLDRVLQIIAGIVSMLEGVVVRRDPAAVETAPVAEEALRESVSGASEPVIPGCVGGRRRGRAERRRGLFRPRGTFQSGAAPGPSSRTFAREILRGGDPYLGAEPRRNGRHQHRPRLVFRPVGRSYGSLARRRGSSGVDFAGWARASVFRDQSRPGARTPRTGIRIFPKC